jgi:hypothetical protein
MLRFTPDSAVGSLREALPYALQRHSREAVEQSFRLLQIR